MSLEVNPKYEELLVEVNLDPKSTYVAIDRAVKYIQRFCTEQKGASSLTDYDSIINYLHEGEDILTFSRPVKLAGTLIIDPVRKSISYITGLRKGKVEFFVFDNRLIFKGSIGSWTGGWSEYINWNRLKGEIQRITFLQEREEYVHLPFHKFYRKPRGGGRSNRYARSRRKPAR